MAEESVKRWLLGLLPGLPVLGLVVAARLLGLFQLAELQALDFGLRSRPSEAKDERITIVSITEEDIQSIGAYPIPDRDIAALIETIDQYQPRAIGLDIFRDLSAEPGHSDFSALVKRLDNLVVINKLLPPSPINPPPAASADQVGFADALPDSDGFVRRSLLGSLDTQSGEYKLSFTIRLAQLYLAEEGLALTNGVRNPAAMRFGETELLPVRSNTGGYVRVDAGGEQIMLNFRSGEDVFETITYQGIQAGEFEQDDFSDRIVLIGLTAPSVKDVVSTAAIEGVNPGLVTGIEVQAHAISQILSAVLDNRPLLSVLPNGLEYVWIVLWGIFGVALARQELKISHFLLSVVFLSSGLLAVGYGFLIAGWWVPIIPTGVAFILNGLVLYPSFQAQRDLRVRLEDRQQLIERTFDQIHNGPLQKLATVLAQVSEESETPDEVERDLRSLNQDLRGIYESLREEFLSTTACLQLAGNRRVRLDQPLHEMLYEVYEHTIQREELYCFKQVKFYIRKFELMSEDGLDSDRKRAIGRFLEEAICNAGKYAKGCTRLTVICMQDGSENVVRVVDNGQANSGLNVRQKAGRGTQQAMSLARQIKGQFKREPYQLQGVVSELRWPVRHKSQ